MLQTTFVEDLEPFLLKAYDTNDFSKYDDQMQKNDAIYLELSRRLRENLIDCVGWKDGRQIRTMTRSLKEEGSVQVTGYIQNKDGTITANYDVQAYDWESLLREVGSQHGKLFVYTLD